jgi:IS30 family transposase
MAGYHELNLAERLSLQRWHEHGEGVRAIASLMGRSASTISRELSRGSERGVYCAVRAQAAATRLRRKPRVERKLSDPARWAEVVGDLRSGWSPQQIAQRLRHERPDDRRGRVSHETIYQAIYLHPRGELRRSLVALLRRGHTSRLPRTRGTDRRSQIPDMKSIHIRPPEVETRLVPGHWEGDLLKGAGNRCAVGVAVERMSGFVVLARMADTGAVATLNGFDAALRPIPPGLRKTLTYDQGREMAAHRALEARLGLEVYFADPHSPWQRGSCENTNGLLRQYLPKGSDLTRHSQDDLNAIALRLNTRPRVRLKGVTPLECFTQMIEFDRLNQPKPQ